MKSQVISLSSSSESCFLSESGSAIALLSLLGFYQVCLGNAADRDSCPSLSHSCDVRQFVTLSPLDFENKLFISSF